MTRQCYTIITKIPERTEGGGGGQGGMEGGVLDLTVH